MAQSVNGVLYVDYFTPTETPGEYTFENAVFNNQNDSTGEGALIIDPSFVMFSPVVDRNTFMPVIGVLNRYKFVNLTYIDTVRISGTIVFDEDGVEASAPGNGVFCLVSKATPNKRLAVPPIDDLYSDLMKGGTIAAMLNDLVNILDKTSSVGTSAPVSPPVQLLVAIVNQVIFELPVIPDNPVNSIIIVNGICYNYGAANDYTISGKTITWLNSQVILEPSDTVIFRW